MGQRHKSINWSKYNRELIQRGSITFWIDKEALANWFHLGIGSGFQKIYSDVAILAVLILKERFQLTLRSAEGFASSIFAMLELLLPVPSYSTLSRRAGKLSVEIKRLSKHKESVHVVIDSTGLKIFGEGEWKVRQHGYSKRRTWRKLHLCVDEDSGEILSSILTDNTYKDSEVFEELLDEAESDILQASADGAYDSGNCYKYCDQNNIQASIPPRTDAKIKRHGNKNMDPLQRDENLRLIREIGKPAWKALSGYSRRSLAETAMYRFKIIFGDKLRSRNFDNQATEAFIKCKLLNKMTTPSAL